MKSQNSLHDDETNSCPCIFSRNASHIRLVCISLRVCASGSMMEYDTENMNSEEIYSSLRGVTEAIQSFSYRSQEDLNEPIRQEGKRDDAVSQSGFSNGSAHGDFSSNHNDINPLSICPSSPLTGRKRGRSVLSRL